MAVLTISRQIGSGGLEIGRQIAEKLGYHFVDKDTIHKVFHQFGFMPFEEFYDSPTSFWDRFDKMRKMTLDNLNRVILTLAQHGNTVIVGRGSYAVLCDFADVLNVRIQAPFLQRVRYVMEKEGFSNRSEAERVLAEKSAIRSGFVESTYQIPWDAASSFDLVINTGRISHDLTVTWITDALGALERKEKDPNKLVRASASDPFLVSAVEAALDCGRTH